MLATSIVIGGIPIPNDRPIFLATLAVHVTGSMVCVAAGALAALSRKRRGRHPVSGRIYYWSLTVAFAALFVLALLRWPHDVDLLAIGTLAFAAATVAVIARRRHRPGWLRVHGTGMAVSYIALLTGFYVDNGANLPLWNVLPHITYWLLPSVIGIPILLRALHRNIHPRPRGGVGRGEVSVTPAP